MNFNYGSIRQSFAKLSILDLFIFCLFAYLFYVLAINFDWLPIAQLMRDSADVLFIEDAAQDLNNGGHLFNWRLTQAPYIFPDIFFARLIVPFVATGMVGPYYHVLFGLLLIIFLSLLSKYSDTPVLPIAMLAALLYVISFIGLLDNDVVSMYFGLIGHHSGVAVPVMLVLLFFAMYQKQPDKKYLLLPVFLFTFLGVSSDSLVVIAVLAPFFFYLITWLYKDRAGATLALHGFFFVILGVILGKMFGYTNPFPQDREFMRFILAQFPNWTIASLKRFPLDIYSCATKSWIFAGILLAYLLAFWKAISHIRLVLKGRSLLSAPTTILAYFIIFVPPLTILMQLGLGVYSGIDSSRQWAVMVYLSIVFGGFIYLSEKQNHTKKLKIYTVLVLSLLCAFLTVALSKNKGITAPVVNRFEKFIDCMRENNFPHGAFYVADYWAARPLRLYSGSEYVVAPMGGGLGVFTNASNISMIRNTNPRFVITGYSSHYDEVIKKLGAPSKEFCNVPLGTSLGRILDYQGNQQALDYLQSVTKNAY